MTDVTVTGCTVCKASIRDGYYLPGDVGFVKGYALRDKFPGLLKEGGK